MDIFNVFNNQTETQRDIQYTDSDTDYRVVDWHTGEDIPPIMPGDTDKPPTSNGWNTTNQWTQPMTVRFGLRLSF